MNEEKTDLDKVLDHEKWLIDPKTKQKPDLSGASLRGADLSFVNLRGADLRGADLSRTDLSRADLSRTDLSRADLSRTDLSGAVFNFASLDLCKGITVLLEDPRDEGYILTSWYLDGKPWFNAGCRSFSKVDALAHWGSENYEDHRRGKLYVDAIEAFDLNK